MSASTVIWTSAKAFERIAPIDFERVMAEVDQALKTGSRLETNYRIRLPDGSDGSVLVLLDSEAAPALATMGRARRTVVTQVAGTRRVAREEWTLGPIAPRVKP